MAWDYIDLFIKFGEYFVFQKFHKKVLLSAGVNWFKWIFLITTVLRKTMLRNFTLRLLCAFIQRRILRNA